MVGIYSSHTSLPTGTSLAIRWANRHQFRSHTNWGYCHRPPATSGRTPKSERLTRQEIASHTRFAHRASLNAHNFATSRNLGSDSTFSTARNPRHSPPHRGKVSGPAPGVNRFTCTPLALDGNNRALFNNAIHEQDHPHACPRQATSQRPRAETDVTSPRSHPLHLRTPTHTPGGSHLTPTTTLPRTADKNKLTFGQARIIEFPRRPITRHNRAKREPSSQDRTPADRRRHRQPGDINHPCAPTVTRQQGKATDLATSRRLQHTPSRALRHLEDRTASKRGHKSNTHERHRLSSQAATRKKEDLHHARTTTMHDRRSHHHSGSPHQEYLPPTGQRSGKPTDHRKSYRPGTDPSTTHP